MILVTGATGNVGRELVGQLVAKRVSVRALCRDPPRAGLPEGAQVCAADLSDAASLPAVLEGVVKAFLLVHVPGDPSQARNFLQAAGAARVRHIVVLSSLSVEALIPGDPIGDGHRQLEQEVRDSSIPATILRPGTFMSNVLFWVDQVRAGDVVRGLHSASAAPIDPWDVASVAALALTNAGHEGRIHALTGGERIASHEQVSVLGEVLGRPLRFEALPQELAREWIKSSFGGASNPDAIIESVTSPPVPWSEPRSTVRDLTGSPPRTFRQWAQLHAKAFL